MTLSPRSSGGGALGWALYEAAAALALCLAGPVLLVLRGRHYLPTLGARLALRSRLPPAVRPGGLWLHAVSVGEVAVAAALARGLGEAAPSLVTTVTPTGQARAQTLFSGRTAVAYLPFELGFAVRRFFERYEPGALVLVEGDYWPLVLRAAVERGLPLAVVNGRVGDTSFRRMRRLRPLLSPLFAGVRGFGVQSAEDARRLGELGVRPERIVVTGNLKYEIARPDPALALEERVRALAAGRPILVAGSTMAGEEEAVFAAFARLGGGARALLVVAPRHPERWDTVAEAAHAAGLRVTRRSALGAAGSAAPPPLPDLLLLDSLGELAALYRVALAAFVGGTLVPTGGHNPLEPAAWGIPVAVGASMENFREIAADFDRAGAWQRVASPEELAETWERWLDDPSAAPAVGARGKALLEENRGALDKTLAMLAELGIGSG